ncbi:hypothetical protein, partial [Yersinia aldovae]|uniref:hypothetical protein n=1 Tax=Yersinia aldovae TaxID=29483 RepID=UPI001C94465A
TDKKIGKVYDFRKAFCGDSSCGKKALFDRVIGLISEFMSHLIWLIVAHEVLLYAAPLQASVQLSFQRNCR